MAVLWMIMSAVCFSGMNLFARIAGAHMHWTVVGLGRAAIGLLIAVAWGYKRKASFLVKNRRAAWTRSIFGTFAALCTFYVLVDRHLSLGDSVTLINLAPVFVALLGPYLLSESPTPATIIALLLSFVGVIFVVRPAFIFGFTGYDSAALTPALVAVSGAFFTSMAIMSLRRLGPSESPEAVVVHFSAVATMAFGALAFSNLATPSLADGLAVLASGVCAGLAQLAMTRAYALDFATRLSSLQYIGVLMSALLGHWVFGESMDPYRWCGIALVIAGGLMVTLSRLRSDLFLQRLPRLRRARPHL